jgi:hypothetical protein
MGRSVAQIEPSCRHSRVGPDLGGQLIVTDVHRVDALGTASAAPA